MSRTEVSDWLVWCLDVKLIPNTKRPTRNYFFQTCYHQIYSISIGVCAACPICMEQFSGSRSTHSLPLCPFISSQPHSCPRTCTHRKSGREKIRLTFSSSFFLGIGDSEIDLTNPKIYGTSDTSAVLTQM